ncbi:MAG: hypothetical protein LZ158_00030 [Thaumarchaeota archaeon]|jgi:rRNA processing protein Gar1|nr:hypothetical protein [Candidatus Terraquivivens yellowstonensis]MCL7387472.1 hypothetical protein [Candidatus Terraquivivens yellowstonensis]MCL7392130.1 hypothetical protein [Candidatus Terraquivivens yellowstonensis]MCL7395092.1 hypothetical protein [Candidatus Terraquivivens yellowstonensis]MCL7397932.1 hypothetical protein [Candidatus Terraquivivens yellowstonensis]
MSRLKHGPVLLGILLHNVGNEAVLKGKVVPRLGVKAYDEELNYVGYVSNIFGPINSHFVAIKLITDKKYPQSSKFYIME